MTIIRNKRSRNFTTIPNDLINDPSLHWQDLGLVVYLLSKPDTWFVRPDILAKERNLRRDGIYEVLKRLRQAGYADLVRYPDGKTEWTIYDQPKTEITDKANPHTENPDRENPYRENPDRENPYIYVNTNIAVKTEEEVKRESKAVKTEIPSLSSFSSGSSSGNVKYMRRHDDIKKAKEARKASVDDSQPKLTRFPKGKFKLTDEMLDYGNSQGLSDEKTREETKALSDKATAGGWLKEDWYSYWVAWIDMAGKRMKQGGYR